jgi:NADP-dependent 3-hydroxy acid dehydrogenase YdfG
MKLNQKIAIVTGASRGIGLAVARALAQDGARVFAVSRSSPPTQGLSSKITPVHADVRSGKDAEKAVQFVLDQAGAIDILVNNAGIEYFKPFSETTQEEYDRVLDTNLRGAFLFTKAVLPTFLTRNSGDLVFINSVSGLRGFSQDSVYCASKHGLHGFATSLEEELRPKGIRVCSVFPGATDTQLSRESWSPPDDPRRQYFLKPEDVAEAVVYILKQPSHVVISQVVMRPLIEPPYSDFLSAELVGTLIQESPARSEE